MFIGLNMYKTSKPVTHLEWAWPMTVHIHRAQYVEDIKTSYTSGMGMAHDGEYS
jgi:hypothetical protein